MIEITPALREQVGCKGLGVSLFSAFEQQGVEQVHGYLANVLEDCRVEPCINSTSSRIIRSINNALSSLVRGDSLDAWSGSELRAACEAHPELTFGHPERSKRLASQASKIVEVEAFGHLANAFHGCSVIHIRERGGRGGKTPDFKIGNDIYIEVYCPDEHNPERDRVENELDAQHGCVKMVISRPVTGSASLAKKYATNQTIARVVGAKRDNDQTVLGCKNILWLDVKHKLQLMTCDTAPIQSVTHGEAVVFFFQAQHFLRHLALVSAKVLVSCLKRLLAGIYI